MAIHPLRSVLDIYMFKLSFKTSKLQVAHLLWAEFETQF